jgi:truncated hemoglobin YjbI
MSVRIRPESLYEHAGGDAGLHRLEQTFYDSVLRAIRCSSRSSARASPRTSSI